MGSGVIVASHEPRECENERCRRWFVGQEKPWGVDPRGTRQMYCSTRCAQATKQRALRRRNREVNA